MKVTMQLDKMSTAEKLQVMEEVWADLHNSPDEVPSPSWHGDVMAAREKRVSEGRSHFGDWGEAKARIREKT